MKASSKSQRKGIPRGLARVRKAMPPPAKIFKSTKNERRKRAKEQLHRELKESLPRKSS